MLVEGQPVLSLPLQANTEAAFERFSILGKCAGRVGAEEFPLEEKEQEDDTFPGFPQPSWPAACESQL